LTGVLIKTFRSSAISNNISQFALIIFDGSSGQILEREVNQERINPDFQIGVGGEFNFSPLCYFRRFHGGSAWLFEKSSYAEG
jgi:hypothetical protein